MRTTARRGLAAHGDSYSVRFPVSNTHDGALSLAKRDRHGAPEHLGDECPECEPGIVARRRLPPNDRRKRE
ncbi:MAG: hypothetical protein E6I66_14040 [Chloroflexi bacterium]|nr:MAG: hypothetical protein E6I66_14040 [Chloroflexota bacterium]